MQDKLKPFRFHGIDFLKQKGGQSVANCPFCGHKKDFWVNDETGQWDCKACSRKGNIFGFLSQFYETLEKRTKLPHYKKISQRRKGIPAIAFKGECACDGDHWYIPQRNGNGTACNLMVWEEGKQTFGTEGMALHLFREDKLTGEGPVYLCEGFWDAIALEWLRNILGESGVVVGVPGCGIFKEDWVSLLKDRDTVLLYDFDGPGMNGMLKAAELLRPSAKSVRCIRWPSSLPEKYDINDFVSERLEQPKRAWQELQGMLVNPFQEAQRKSRKIPSFQTVLKGYRKFLHLDKNMEQGLAICFAVALSNQIPGDPIWLFLVGPPGAGKTLLLRSLEDIPGCLFRSSLTPHSLLSGFRDGDEGEDPSLLAQLMGNPGKCLVLKDYTEIKSMPQIAQEEIYGVLRGAYDGKVEKTFGNQVQRNYEGFFSILAGVTDVIHGDMRATLGERFLKFEFVRDKFHDAEKHIRAALASMNSQAEEEALLKQIAFDFLDREVTTAPTVPKWLTDRLVYLSQIIGYLRACVARTYHGDMAYRPRPEVGSRLARQLQKLSRCLAVVYGKKTVDMQCYQIVEQVAFDTCLGWHQEIVKSLIKETKPVTIQTLAEIARISQSSLRRKIDDLIELGIICRSRTKRVTALGPGQPAFGYALDKRLVKLWKQAKVTSK